MNDIDWMVGAILADRFQVEGLGKEKSSWIWWR